MQPFSNNYDGYEYMEDRRISHILFVAIKYGICIHIEPSGSIIVIRYDFDPDMVNSLTRNKRR